MIVAFVFLGTGASLFLLMLAWRDTDGGVELEEATHPPDPCVMRRILSREDLRYVVNLRNPQIRRFFLRERRRLALDWLRACRTEAFRLLRNHTDAVRHSSDVRPAGEIRILATFASLLLVYSAMAWVVRLLGPFRAPALLRSVEYLTASLESLNRALTGVARPEIKAYSA